MIVGSQTEAQQSQFLVAERDVEIERMKTTLEALNEKLTVTADLEKEGQQSWASFKDSEGIRTNKLQVHITTSAETLVIDASNNTDLHNKELARIDEL